MEIDEQQKNQIERIIYGGEYGGIENWVRIFIPHFTMPSCNCKNGNIYNGIEVLKQNYENGYFKLK